MTLEEIASAIQNDIGSGLREVSNYAYSLEQIYDEINNVWNSIVSKTALEGGSSSLNHFSMKIDNLEMDYAPFPYNTSISSPSSVPHIKIPRLAMTIDNSALLFLGSKDMSFSFKTYYKPESLKTHQYSRVIKNRPYAYIEMSHNEDATSDVYLFNLNSYGLKSLAVRLVPANPVDILLEKGDEGKKMEFPAPGGVQSQIIEIITNKYIRYYKQLNPGYQPNTQTDQK